MAGSYNIQIDKVYDLLRKPRKITILSHKNPDGDAIGSCLGLYHFLKSSNHEVKVIIPNEIPEFLMWLPGADNILIFSREKEEAKKIIQESELFFFLDFNSSSRIDKVYKIIKEQDVPVVLIDHHPNPQDIATLTFSDPSVSSTAELVYRVINDLTQNYKLSKEVAECLFVGIMTDTGCFAYNSSSPETYKIVSDFLRTGIDKDDIYNRVYDNYSVDRMRLLGNSLKNKLEYFPEFRTAIISITADELKQHDFKIGDTEGFVNYPLTIKDVVFSALFIEKKQHVKISFRSKGSFPVNEFSSRHFEGGGHTNAAGGEAKDSLANVLKRFRELLPTYKDDLLKV